MKFNGILEGLEKYMGVFIATDVEVEKLLGETLYLGECLGKHSDVEWTVEEGEINLVTDNPQYLEETLKVFGTRSIWGLNPVEAFKEQEEY